MSGEPIRLLNDSSIRDEIRERLARESAVKPEYDVERGLARLRAAIAAEGGGGGAGPSVAQRSVRLAVSNYAVKGSVWKVAGVVGLAGTATIVGLHAWGPARHVAGLGEVGSAPAAPERAEADNLVQIKTVIASDPRTALQLVEDGNQRFSAGPLREEREANAVLALALLGRDDEAKARARRFLVDFPKSSLSERVRQSARL